MITPRKPEVERVVALLESGEHEDAAGLAKDLVKTIASLIQERDGAALYCVALEGAPVGPFYSELEAKRWQKDTERKHGLAGVIVPLWTPGVYDLKDELEEAGVHCGCGHLKEQHVVKATRGKPGKPMECGVFRARGERCSCSGYHTETKENRA